MAESLIFTSYQKFLKKYKLIENVTAYKCENEIHENIIKLFMEEFGREPNNEELKDILEYQGEIDG